MPKRPKKRPVKILTSRAMIKKARLLNAQVDPDPEPSRDPHLAESGPGWNETIIVHDNEDSD